MEKFDGILVKLNNEGNGDCFYSCCFTGKPKSLLCITVGILPPFSHWEKTVLPLRHVPYSLPLSYGNTNKQWKKDIIDHLFEKKKKTVLGYKNLKNNLKLGKQLNFFFIFTIVLCQILFQINFFLKKIIFFKFFIKYYGKIIIKLKSIFNSNIKKFK